MLRSSLKARDTLILIAAGAAAATGFQPLALWPLTLAALALLIDRVEHAKSARRAALIGWLFGFGHFTTGNGWIATAFTYQAQMPAWLGWVAVALIALYLAVFPAFASLAAWTLQRRWDMAFVPAFAGCWIVTEWVRSWLFSGFAWNPLAMVALGDFARPGLAHVAIWTGTYALSGLVVLLAGFWLFAWRAAHKARWPMAAGYALLPTVLFLLPLEGDGRTGNLAYTLVQPDIGQDEINDPRQFEAQFRKTAALSLPQASAVPDPAVPRIVLWPEGGVPDYLRPGYDRMWYEDTTYAADPDLARARIGRVIGPRSLLFTGATDLAPKGHQIVGAWNVITAVDGNGTIRGGYAKAHLVPFGEYLPMRTLLEPIGLSRMVAGTLDFFPGPGPRTTDFGVYGKAGFQICYEIIFSGRVADRAHRPDYIFNPSNDGWFGAWGPPQHLAQARMRAIEEGLPVLRSTTTGISAVIDADGVVRQFVPRLTAGRLDGMLPPAHAPTLFAQAGNVLGLGWAAVLLLLALVATRRRGR